MLFKSHENVIKLFFSLSPQKIQLTYHLIRFDLKIRLFFFFFVTLIWSGLSVHFIDTPGSKTNTRACVGV